MAGENVGGDRCEADDAVASSLVCCCRCGVQLSQRPVLWPCLHGYCEECHGELFSVSGPVTCVACGSPAVLDFCRRDCHVLFAWATVKGASFAAAQSATVAADGLGNRYGRLAACDTCHDDGVASKASHQCSGCRRMLCDDCRLWHERFPCANGIVSPVDVCSADGDAAGLKASSSGWRQPQQEVPVCSSSFPEKSVGQLQRLRYERLCPAHVQLLDFYCFSCCRLKCTECIKDCMEARHDSLGVTNIRTTDRADGAVRELKEALSCLHRLEADVTDAAGAEAAEEALIAANHKLALEVVSFVYYKARTKLNADYDQLVDKHEVPLRENASRPSPIDARLRHVVKYGSTLANAADASLAAASAAAAAVTSQGGCSVGADSSQLAAPFQAAASFAPIGWMLEQKPVALELCDALSCEAKQLLDDDNVTLSECFPADKSTFTILGCDADSSRLLETARRFIAGYTSEVIAGSSSSSVEADLESGAASTGRSELENCDSVCGLKNKPTTRPLAADEDCSKSSLAVGPPTLVGDRSASDQTSVTRESSASYQVSIDLAVSSSYQTSAARKGSASCQSSVDYEGGSSNQGAVNRESSASYQAFVDRSLDSQETTLATTSPLANASLAEPVQTGSHVPAKAFTAGTSPSANLLPAESVQTGSYVSGGSHVEFSPLSTIVVDEIVDSFRAVSTCHDVACTADGHILLAALQNGLKQYEASTGRKCRTWYPEGVEGRLRIVSTVDVLPDDGRVAAGLIGAQCIALLRRESPDSWIEECRLGIDAAPYRLAVRGEQLVVACADVRDTDKSCGWQPGSMLCFGRLPWRERAGNSSSRAANGDGGRGLLNSFATRSRTLSYGILGVALLDESAIVSSHDRQSMPADGASLFVVEAYADGGSGPLLWQYRSPEDVFDLYTITTSCVVYLALPRSLRIVALSGLDGTMLGAVVEQSTHTVVSPNRLAFSLPAADAAPSGSRRLLVILSGNGVVSLYPTSLSIPTS